MITKKIQIYEDRIQCQKCLENIIMILSQIKRILFLDINMESKMIRLKYQDDEIDNNEIIYLIECAVSA